MAQIPPLLMMRMKTMMKETIFQNPNATSMSHIGKTKKHSILYVIIECFNVGKTHWMLGQKS